MSQYYDEYTGYQAMLNSSMEIHLYRDKDMEPQDEQMHDFFELVLVTDGAVEFVVQERRDRLCKGDLILLRPGIAHREIPEDGYYERFVLWINPWYLSRLSTRKTNLSNCFVIAEKRGYVVRFEPSFRNQIRTLLNEMVDETHRNAFGSDLMLDALLKGLLVLLDRGQTLLQSDPAEETEPGRNIQEIVRYVDLHYTDNLTLDSLSEAFYISKFYLSRSFEHFTGKSIHQYVLEKRMQMAKQLLLFGERPMDIYGLCGFADYSNFYRTFKKYYQVSPNQFLKNLSL